MAISDGRIKFDKGIICRALTCLNGSDWIRVKGENIQEGKMECHKCGFAERIKTAEFENVPWSETPCSRCELTESSKATIEYDDDRSTTWDQRQEDQELGSGVDLMPVSVLADAVSLMLALPKDALEVLRLRYGGMPYREIADTMGLKVDAVEKRLGRTLTKNPVLGTLFPRKVRKQAARRRRRLGLGASAITKLQFI